MSWCGRKLCFLVNPVTFFLLIALSSWLTRSLSSKNKYCHPSPLSFKVLLRWIDEKLDNTYTIEVLPQKPVLWIAAHVLLSPLKSCSTYFSDNCASLIATGTRKSKEDCKRKTFGDYKPRLLKHFFFL